MSSGSGDGNDTIGNGVVGGSPSGSSVTRVNVGLEEGSFGSAGSEIVMHPLDSNNIKIVRAELQTLLNVMPTYSGKDLTMLAKRLIVLATRTPWTVHPILAAEEGYAERWQRDIPQRAAYYFPTAVDAAVKATVKVALDSGVTEAKAKAAGQASVVCVAAFLESRCDDIYDRKALLFMFVGCIAALPQNECVSPIMTLLSIMVRHPELCDAKKLPGRLELIKPAIRGLSRNHFDEVYLSLCEIEGKMKKRDPQSQIGANFIRGITDLHHLSPDRILT